MQRHEEQLARRVAREGDPARPSATLTTNGIPANTRLIPPWSGITSMRTLSSFQSMTWCSKKMRSLPPRLISATGTISPSTWQELPSPKRTSVMSRRRGASRHPESLTRFLTSSGAPHAWHDVAFVGFCTLHHEQTRRWSGSIATRYARCAQNATRMIGPGDLLVCLSLAESCWMKNVGPVLDYVSPPATPPRTLTLEEADGRVRVVFAVPPTWHYLLPIVIGFPIGLAQIAAAFSFSESCGAFYKTKFSRRARDHRGNLAHGGEIVWYPSESAGILWLTGATYHWWLYRRWGRVPRVLAADHDALSYSRLLHGGCGSEGGPQARSLPSNSVR